MLPMPSQRGHMPPATEKVFLTAIGDAPRSTLIAPVAETDGTLKANACGPPMLGCPSRLNRMRSRALASVTVPTVERTLAPMRSWSTMIAVVRPSSESTSGRARLGMKVCTKALYVSLMRRCDSAAIVSKTSELLPEPDTPVNTVMRRLGRSRSRLRRLFSRAPLTSIAPQALVSGASLQPTAFLTSSTMRFSTAGVRAMTANSVGHMSPSSSWAAGWKPRFE